MFLMREKETHQEGLQKQIDCSPNPRSEKVSTQYSPGCPTYLSEYAMYPVTGPETKPWNTSVKVEGHDLVMEIDAGAVVISETTFNQVCDVSTPSQLTPCTLQLHCHAVDLHR